LIVLLFLSCQKSGPHFDDFFQRYEKAKWQQFPDWASSVGQSDYHSILIIPNEEKRTNDLVFCRSYLDSINFFDPEKLPASQATKWLDLKEQLTGNIHQLETDQSWKQDPSFYNVLGPVQHVLDAPQITLEKRLELLYKKMKAIPQYYQAAQDNLENPNKRLVDKAIMEHEKTFAFFQHTLSDSLKQSQLSASAKSRIRQRINQSKISIKNYIALCNSMRFEFDQLQRFQN
jgi:Bacterial protein of unknown function (DUF885).